MRKLLLNLLLYPFSFLWPRRPLRWAFGAADDAFEGNTRELFLWVSRGRPEVEAVWVSGDRNLVERLRREGYRAEVRWSIAGVRTALSAAVHLVTRNGGDVNFHLSGGATIFNLWHGVGIKNILRGAAVGRNASLFRARWFLPLYLRSLERFRAPELVLSTSPTMTAHFARCFGVPPSRCVESGYPRQDPAFNEELRRLSLAFDDAGSFEAAKRSFRRVYLYAPTLRQGAKDVLELALPDLTRLSEALRRHDAVLFLKPHPLNPVRQDRGLHHDNIRGWPLHLDLYSVLAEIDGLITDYSSMLYDFIDHHEAGVIIYDFDFEQFVAHERDLAFPFEENIIGLRARTFDDLCRHLENDAACTPLDPMRLALLRERFWGRVDDGRALACPRIAGHLIARARRAAPRTTAPRRSPARQGAAARG